MKHGLVEVLDQIADDDRDFQWESPKFEEPIQAVYAVIQAPR